MTEVIVSKFGGTSNADAAAVAQSAELGADSRVLVTSAPGKLSDAQLAAFSMPAGVSPEFFGSKVTDQLLAAHASYATTGEVPRYIQDSITARYAGIVSGLGIRALEDDWLRDIAPRLVTAAQFGEDYASMLGERLQAEVYRAMGWRLLDPARAGLPVLPRDRMAWRTWLGGSVASEAKHVLPGNTWSDGQRLHTFDRGGSDISGALASFAVYADVYRNMTDTPAQSADPRLIRDPARRRTISHLTYEEGRELGRNGTGLLHPEAIIPLMGTGITTEIRDTFDPNGQHTVYSDEVDDASRTGEVMAISLIPNTSVVTAYEPGMSESKGRIAALSAGVALAGVSVIDVVGSGSDTELFIVDAGDEKAVMASLAADINEQGKVSAEQWALITLVGYMLKRRASAIRRLLEEEAGLGEDYQRTDPYWLEGRHSLRFTVKRDEAAAVVDMAHACLIESR
jgi:aspartate kinase